LVGGKGRGDDNVLHSVWIQHGVGGLGSAGKCGQ
jgi:hypothetical protein